MCINVNYKFEKCLILLVSGDEVIFLNIKTNNISYGDCRERQFNYIPCSLTGIRSTYYLLNAYQFAIKKIYYR